MQFLKPDNIMPEYIERTLKNLNYIELHRSKTYEVTQFINALVGLLILPKESTFNRIEDTDVPNSLLERIRNQITVCKTGCKNNNQDEAKNLQNIVKHLRNGICHWHIEFYGSNDIEEIRIQDFIPKTNIQTFEGRFDVNLLREFILEFSTSMAQKIKNGNIAKKGGN